MTVAAWIAQFGNGVCGLDKWIAGEWHRCLFEPVTALTGDALFGLMVGSGLWIAFYFAAGGSIAAPTAALILVASLLFPILPGSFIGIAYGVLLIGVAAAVLNVMQRYVLNPSTA